MQQIILHNGLLMMLHPMPNTHSVTISLNIRAGSGYGEPHRGITHFLEHLHFRRMGDMTQRDLYYQMECIGSTLRAVTYRDMLRFSMKVVPVCLDKCLDIFVRLIEAREWTEEDVELERQVVLNQIYEKGSYVSAEQAMRESVFKNHPLSWDIMGTPEDVLQITREALQQYKAEIFDASRMILCVTGNVTPAQIQMIQCRFGQCTIAYRAKDKVMALPAGFHRRKPDVQFVHVNDNNPLDVQLSFDITYQSWDWGLLTILNCILGEGVGSRLQRCLREEKCYSSNVSSYVEWYSDFAVLHITFSVGRNQCLAALEDALAVVHGLQSDIQKSDLDVSLPFYTTNQVFLEDDTEEMNAQISVCAVRFRQCYQPLSLTNTTDTIRSLRQLASQIFTASNLTMVIVGNTNRFTKKSFRQLTEILDKGDA